MLIKHEGSGHIGDLDIYITNINVKITHNIYANLYYDFF